MARVNDEFLYITDVAPFTKGLKGQDSADVIKTYAENWVHKKLLLKKAIDNIAPDDVSIVQKVEDYKESLLLYEYEKALVNRKLDTKVSLQELTEWYEKMKTDFPLQQDVYQLKFIKFKIDAPDMEQASKWILKPKSEDDELKLEGYCKEYASTYSIAEGMWYTQENILKNFPVKESDVAWLNNHFGFKEYKTDDGIWFISMIGHREKDEPSPLAVVKEEITRVIIEKRRLKLIENIYDKIYQDGIKEKSFEVFAK